MLNQNIAAPLVALVTMLSSAMLPVHAAEIDLNVGDKSFSGQFTGTAPNLRDTNAQYQFGFLTRPNDDNRPTLRQYHGQFLVSGDAGATEFEMTAGLGARLLYLDIGPFDGFTVAFGGQARAKVPTADRFSIGAYGYIAPSVTSFSDVEGYTQIGADAAYEIIRGGSIYVGARHVRYKFENAGRFTVDNGAHIGLRLTF